MQWDRNNEGRRRAAGRRRDRAGARLRVPADKPQIELGEKVRRAVISDNVITGKARITNHSKATVSISNNASD